MCISACVIERGVTRELRSMAIANPPDESPGQKPESSDLGHSLRRRPNTSSVPDSSSKANGNSTSNGDESSTGTNSDYEDCASNGNRNGGTHAEDTGKKVADGEDRTREPDVSVRFTYRPAVPAHRRVQESPLSSDAIFKQSHAGLFNLCIVVLVAVNSRLIIENLMKYGLLIGSGFWFSSWSLRDWPLLMCCLTLPFLFLASLMVEKLVQHKLIFEVVAGFLHLLITTSAIVCPVVVILRCNSAVLSGITLMLFACIVWLKLVSYAHTNFDLRSLAKAAERGDASLGTLNVDLSYNVNFKSLAYFMVAPTLCYQLTYPRGTNIRKGWVTRQVIKLVIFTGFMGFIIEQYINPIVKNSQHPLNGNFLYAIERVLKLSVPTLYVWLCMFYCFFHLWLNILAEILRFGAREFYKDWWNAKTIEEYWRMWNMPVHKWMVRHVYFPCLRNGIPKGVAIFIAFFVSAVFHELCIGVPCRNFKLWAFIGIMFQIPLVLVTNFLQARFRNSMVGNTIFWLFFCILGQPMCVLLYYHDWMN
ncbi:diacylglycerol O-acyltransferase 1-like isoform X2 [Aristolochia californica]|uniref:diacylglycerol O-acyltransferase 1-like isoform X2 n=1 Tax=Aristolochia californica TaxID=171875 RepID=UPI0035DF5850